MYGKIRRPKNVINLSEDNRPSAVLIHKKNKSEHNHCHELWQGCQMVHLHIRFLVYFGGPLNETIGIFLAIGIFDGHLVYFVVIWFIL
jgi:hypothetical protein